jgi:membrane-associated phospholipid phosphatase
MSSAPLTASPRTARHRAGGPAREQAGRAPEPSIAWALWAALLCALAMAATWALAELVPAIHLRDAVLLNDFTKLERPRVDRFANHLLHLLDPLLYTVWALLIVAVALLRRRPRVALAVAVVLPAAPGIAELLKPLLAHAHDRVGYQWIGAASWPSGHATAAMTLVLCALLVTPHRLRPLVAALGCAFAVAVGCSLLILAWHMPSDVLGGYLLAALCVSLTIVAMGRNWDRPRARRGPIAAPRPAR